MFTKYQHLERFNTPEVENIQYGECFVFPKLDGTNSSVWIHDGEIKAGSRNRILSLENDNQGFLEFVLKQKNIAEFLKENENYILYGEWLVPHTIKTYRLSAWNKFYVFDVFDKKNNKFLHYNEYKVILDKFEIEYIAPMGIVVNGNLESFEFYIDRNFYLLADESVVGEGIVIKNYNFINDFGRTVWAKIVTNEFKEANRKVFDLEAREIVTTELKIVNKYLTEDFILKEYNKFLNTRNFSKKLIPELLKTIFYEFVKEEVYNIIFELKLPTIDFKHLHALVVAKIKEILFDVFSK